MNKHTPKSAYSLVFVFLSMVTIVSCNQDFQLSEVEATHFPMEEELSDALIEMESNPESALQTCKEIINRAEERGAFYYSGKAKFFLGYIHEELLDNVSEAYFNYNEALRDLLKTDSSELKMKVYNNLGILYRYYGQYDAAIQNYQSALALEKDLDAEKLSDLYYNLGVAYKLKGDAQAIALAESAFTRSLELAKPLNDHENIASVHNQIGLMYKDLGNYEMARIAYNNTISLYNDVNPSSDVHEYVGKAYHGIGVTFMDEGEIESSIEAFTSALGYKTSSASIFVTKYDLGSALMMKGQGTKAVQMWKAALREKHNKNDREQVEIYADLTTALASNNNYEEAVGYADIYHNQIQNILSEGEKYKSENDAVLFKDIVREYSAFSQPVPFFERPLGIALSMLSLLAISSLAFFYFRLKVSRSIEDTVSKIQMEFQNIKIE